MSSYTMQQVIERIVAVTGQDPVTARNQFRTWVGKGVIPAAEAYGTGTGTRRRYDEKAVALAAVMIRLSQLGVGGEELWGKAEFLRDIVLARRWDGLRAGVAADYLVAIAPGTSTKRVLILSEMQETPNAALLKQAPGGAAYVVDVGGLVRTLAKLP